MDAIDRWLDDAELAPAPLDTHDADVVVLGEMNHFVNEKSDFRLALASPLVERGYDVWGEELGWSDGTRAIVPRVHHDYRQACMGECGNQRGLIAPGRLDEMMRSTFAPWAKATTASIPTLPLVKRVTASASFDATSRWCLETFAPSA